jgi:pre-mRNA-splicing factor 18
MDLLLKEMQRKKQALAAAATATVTDETNKGSSSKRKYLRVSDIRRIEEEQEEKEKEDRRHQKRTAAAAAAATTPTNHKLENENEHETDINSSSHVQQQDRPSSKKRPRTNQDSKPLSEEAKDKSAPPSSLLTLVASKKNIQMHTPAELTKQLRGFGIPVRFFGETHNDRVERLQDALEKQKLVLAGLSEMEEFRLGKGHEIRNPFLEKDDNNNNKSKQAEKKEQDNAVDDDDDDTTDPHKRIYKYFKGLLKEWEEDLSQRPGSVAKTVAGKNESKTLKQCKDYIRPLFRLCKKRRLEASLEAHLIKIVTCAQEGEFVRAHDAYIDVAIGRAAWPIGVTMVGIHARSGRAKIESANVAHVMNSELQRKYLTSVKRLLTFAQKKRTDVAPSKKVF